MYYRSKSIINKNLNLKKKFREIAKNVDTITNIFRNISKLENKNDFNDCNLIITIKNYDEIVNILKYHFENNISKKKSFSFFKTKQYLTIIITFISIK